MRRLFTLCVLFVLGAGTAFPQLPTLGKYYQPVIVNNTANPATLTDYSVLLKVNTAVLVAAGKMKADGSDIRFTTDSTDELSYWIDPGIQNEYGANRDSTHIWVKMPVIPGGAKKTIYLFYGDPTAAAKSNISAAFIFGDDFNDNKLDTAKWQTDYDAQGKIIEQNQRLEHASPPTTPQSNSFLFSKPQFSGPLVLEMQFKKGGYVYRSLGLTRDGRPAKNYAYFQWQDWGAFSGGVVAKGVQSDKGVRDDYWSTTYNPEYYLKIVHREDGTFSFSQDVPASEPGGPLSWSATVTDRTMPLDSAFKIFAYDGMWVYGGGSGPRYEDNIRVRKYSSPEPFASFTDAPAPAAPAPVISSVTPASGPVGTVVTITGENFNADFSKNIVWFGAVKTVAASASATMLTVAAPAGASYAPISVTDTTTGLTAYSTTPFAVTFAGSPQIDTTSFASPLLLGTSTNPEGIALGDLDGDGKPDLAVVKSNSSTVSVFRNISSSGALTASSSFAAGVDFPTGTAPYGIAIGDLNGDGRPELITANVSGGGVSVFRNTSTPGSITFDPKIDFATGASPYQVAIGDMNGDGRPDLVAPNSSGNTVSILQNTDTSGAIGAGAFATKVDLATGTSPFGVVVGDMDGDGKQDIAVTNILSNSVSVYRNAGAAGGMITAGTFAPQVEFATSTTSAHPYDIAIGDIDGDGKQDLAVANISSNTVSVFRNTNTPGSITSSSFDSKVDFATGGSPYNIDLGDIDGDGKPDIAVANAGSNTVSLLRNTSTVGAIAPGSFAARHDLKAGKYPYAVAIGDLDGDGKPEVVVSNEQDQAIAIFRNTISESGLVAYYPFTNKADDESGYGNHGTEYGGIAKTADRFGNAGGAYNFNGSTDYILIGDPVPEKLKIQNDITLSAWIRVTQMPAELGMIVGSQYDQTASGASIMIDGRTTSDGQPSPAGHIHFQIGNGTWHATNTNSVVPFDQWVLITAVRKANEDAQVYYNAELQPSTSAAWDGSITYQNAWLAIGRQKDLIRAFTGAIDDVRLYNRALTAAEVAALYNEGGLVFAPIISTFAPQSGPVGTSVSIAGSHFGQTQGTSLVKFGTVTAVPSRWSDTMIVVPVPAGVSGSVDVSVTVNAKTAAGGSLFMVETVSGPVISIPPSIAFGSVAAGTSLKKTLSIGNAGTAALTGTLFVGTNTGYALSTTVLNVGVGSAQNVDVTFSPLAAQNYNAAITVTHNAAGSPSTVALSGTGQVTGSAPTIAVSPASILMMKEGVAGGLSSVSINVSNSGGQTLTGAVTYSGTTLLKLSSGASLSVAAGSSSFITLQQNNLAALAPGTYSGSITITHNAAGSAVTIPVEVRIVVIPNTVTIAKTIISPSPEDPKGYDLVSIPGGTWRPAASIVEGEYKTDWRLYRDNGAVSNYLVEYDGSSAFDFAAGKGFWLLTRKGLNASGTVPNVTSANGAYPIALQTGWNIIADPFERAVQWSDVRKFNALPANAVIYGWNGGAWSQALSMVPFKAYYYNNLTGAASLSIPYDPSGVFSKTAADGGEGPYVSSRAVRLSLSSNGREVAAAVAGFDSASCTDYDANDYPAPPAVFAVAGMEIENTAPHMPFARLAVDHRKDVSEGQVFDLLVRNTTTGACTIDAEGMQTLPGEEVYLKNARTQMSYDLRRTRRIDVPPSPDEVRYQLVIGSKAYVQKNGIAPAPTAFAVSQNYPNPFNPSTTIRYGLPRAARVSVAIFNTLGQEVAQLVNGMQAEGWHEAVWNAGAAATGMYFYRIEAVDAGHPNERLLEVRKMLLVK